MTTPARDDEVLLVGRLQAPILAEKYRSTPDALTSQIGPSLLSAEHIRQYVERTGLIAPFYVGGGDKSRLKKASYEGRIGKKAYLFDDDGQLLPVLVPDRPLLVPANTIVFVECDLDFRLPLNIALRFNLQIKHVHRGLLLGTGPLVDPGYWGKLCIPLHNLTNRDYEIPLKEGLIWVEFTKTTSDSGEGRIALPEGEYWDIEKFLRKAAQPDKTKAPIGITSSIRSKFEEAKNIAKVAEITSNTALEKSTATAAIAEKAQSTIRTISLVGALGAVAGIVGIWCAFEFGVRNDITSATSRIDQLISDLSKAKSASETALEQVKLWQARHDELTKRLERGETEIETLRRENQTLRQHQLAPGTPASSPSSNSGAPSGR